MRLIPQNIIHHELIGLNAKVEDSTNRSLIGIEGRIIDETRNMLTIETSVSEKKIPKSGSSFILMTPSSMTPSKKNEDFSGKRYLPLKIKVDGRLLLSQPENRIQTKFKKKFRR